MSRVVLDDDPHNDYFVSSSSSSSSSSTPLQPPNLSSHWLALNHQPGDELIPNLEGLLVAFRSDLIDNQDWGRTIALWSCVAGYAEALATHKIQRYHVFPLPFEALERLVEEEFVAKIKNIVMPPTQQQQQQHPHRTTVQAISNLIWSTTLSKPHIRDELHANSVYVWLRGQLDRKSLDCLGAAVTTIAGCRVLGLTSQLTLSEDHAYEQHVINNNQVGTCEVAVPGTTKAAQAKRGQEIASTFTTKDATITPETSWLYMALNPVVCDTLGMTLVALVANMNCVIDKTSASISLASRQLYEMKRELLWILHDAGHMSKFPFGLLELGDCEEHCPSPRSLEYVNVPTIPEPILTIEKLYWDAIQINKTLYNEAQVYPYLYAGHYHKDAGNLGPDHEYRLVHAMKYYADAARVASQYRYEVGALQLNKHMSVVAMLIAQDILCTTNTTTKCQNNNKVGSITQQPQQDVARTWIQRENALATGTWLLGFFDSLLYWEEVSSNGKQFVEILSPTHKYGIGKLFQLLSQDVRAEIVTIVTNGMDLNNENKLLPELFCQVRAKRFSSWSLLLRALQKPKVSISEMELAIISMQDENGRSKRIRR